MKLQEISGETEKTHTYTHTYVYICIPTHKTNEILETKNKICEIK